MIMKNFNIIASKEVVASFKMDYDTYKMKFKCKDELVAFIRDKHPEYLEIPYNVDFPNDDIVVEFYSVGDIVIEEK